MASNVSLAEDPLIAKVTAYMKDYMSHYDSSHDFNHLRRVLGLANHLADQHPDTSPPLNRTIVTLAALLHDVGDRKYLTPDSPDASTLITNILLEFGVDTTTAAAVAEICLAVSWNKEAKDPERVAEVLSRRPELGVVQDADRLDAIGAVGVGRCFCYGAAKTGRPMEGSIEHFDQKLLRVEERMKTKAGREMARERTERLRLFKEWWEEEAAFAVED